MKTIGITQLQPDGRPSGHVEVTLDRINKNCLESLAVEVIDDDPNSLHKELFGEAAPAKYYIPAVVHDEQVLQYLQYLNTLT